MRLQKFIDYFKPKRNPILESVETFFSKVTPFDIESILYGVTDEFPTSGIDYRLIINNRNFVVLDSKNQWGNTDINAISRTLGIENITKIVLLIKITFVPGSFDRGINNPELAESLIEALGHIGDLHTFKHSEYQREISPGYGNEQTAMGKLYFEF